MSEEEKINKIAFIDTETTGLDRRRHEPWEVAAVVHTLEENGTVLGPHLDTMHFFVEPTIFTDADPVALKYNKFWERTGMPGFRWGDKEENASDLARLLNESHIAAMNVTFDRDMIDIFFDYAGFPQGGWHYHLVELETLMMGFLIHRGIRVPIPYKSDDLSRSLGVEPPPKGERHTALADATWCRDVFATIWPSLGVSHYHEDADVPDWARVEST